MTDKYLIDDAFDDDSDCAPVIVDPTLFDRRHGGPFDRGAADNYYRRPFNPHYFAEGTYSSAEIKIERGTPEYTAYRAGWDYNEWQGDKKDWG